jgi:hypothetical protein
MTDPTDGPLILLSLGYALAVLATIVTGTVGVHGGYVRRIECPAGYWIVLSAHAIGGCAVLAFALRF